MSRPARPLRRTVLAGLLAAVTLAGCGGESPDDLPTTTQAADRLDAMDPETGCGPVEHPALHVASHLVGDAEPPSPYSSTPPTSGWHTAQVPATGLHDQPLRDPEIVAALESGIVVVAVAPDELPDELDDGVASDLVAQFPDRLIVVPYPTEMDTPVALLTWGAVQRCRAVDPTAVTAFVLDQRTAAEH